MQGKEYFTFPLYSRHGTIRAYARIDEADRHLSELGWSMGTGGYATRTVWVQGLSRKIYLHRLVLGLSSDDPRQGDHVNRDRLDCRRENLRIATGAQNAQNQPARIGLSAYRGVTFDSRRNRWHARASINRQRHHLGYFKTEEEANAAAVAFRKAHLPYSVEAS